MNVPFGPGMHTHRTRWRPVPRLTRAAAPTMRPAQAAPRTRRIRTFAKTGGIPLSGTRGKLRYIKARVIQRPTAVDGGRRWPRLLVSMIEPLFARRDGLCAGGGGRVETSGVIHSCDLRPTGWGNWVGTIHFFARKYLIIFFDEGFKRGPSQLRRYIECHGWKFSFFDDRRADQDAQ